MKDELDKPVNHPSKKDNETAPKKISRREAIKNIALAGCAVPFLLTQESEAGENTLIAKYSNYCNYANYKDYTAYGNYYNVANYANYRNVGSGLYLNYANYRNYRDYINYRNYGDYANKCR